MSVVGHEEYIKELEPEVKEGLSKIKALVEGLVPEAELLINYGVPTFKLKGKNLVHFGAFKDHWSFFPGPVAIEAFKDRLNAYQLSKGTIKLPFKSDIDLGLLEDIVIYRLKELEGYIVVTALVKKNPAEVWNAWTDVDEVVNWNFASDDWHCPMAMSDLRAGGYFVYNMAAKDGSFDFDFAGNFEEVEEEKFISYILADQRKVEIYFSETAEGIFIIEAFMPESENSLELQKEGWGSILNNFKKYVEGKN